MNEYIGLTGKIVVAFASTAYTAGLLISNIDLATYGIATFSLNRPQYIVIGTLWIVLTIMTALPAALAIWLQYGGRRLRTIRGVATMLPFTVAVMFLMFKLLCLGSGPKAPGYGNVWPCC